MADHTSITDTTPQPILETPSAEPKRLSRLERREVNLRHIRETILESFAAHDSRMCALSRKPPRARRICQIILHGPHSDGAAMVAVDEPYTLIVTSNRIPAKAEEWRAGTMATLTERLGMPVHITLMKQGRFLDHCKAVTPFYEALSIAHETLYPNEGQEGGPDGSPEDTPKTPEEIPEETPEEKPASEKASQEAPAEDAIPDGWQTEHEVQLYQEIHRRAGLKKIARKLDRSYLPDEQTLLAMEEPICQLMGGAVLLRDVALAAVHDIEPRGSGLNFLSCALSREAEAVYRLYTGYRPGY